MRSAIVAGLLAWCVVSSAAPKRHKPGALVVVIDRSMSMRGPAMAMRGSRLDVAKQATRAALAALDRSDQVAIVAFDSEARIVAPLQTAANRSQIANELAKLDASGGTNVYPALKTAFDVLEESTLAIKHVIVISDGGAPADGIPELITEMRASSITVSTVGIEGADRSFLAMIADAGDGRSYMLGDVKAVSTFVTQDLDAARQ